MDFINTIGKKMNYQDKYFILYIYMKTLIPLGHHCNITELHSQLGIKKETGVFEWLEGWKLQYITNVINALINNPDENIFRGKNNKINLLHEGFFTRHYKFEEYKIIFKRRYERFLKIIKSTEDILFVRINPINRNNTTVDEINLFVESIKKINSDLKINFLLIDTVDKVTNFKPLNMDTIIFHHKYFIHSDCITGDYLQDNPIISEIYQKMLIDVGYINDEVFYRIWTDRS